MKVIDRIKNVKSFGFNDMEQLVFKNTDNEIFKGDEKLDCKGRMYINFKDNSISYTMPEYVDIYDLNFTKLIRIRKKNAIVGGRTGKFYDIRWEDEDENEFLSIYDNHKEIYRHPDICIFFLEEKKSLLFDGFDIREISLYNWGEKRKIWSYKLSEDYEVFGAVHIMDDVLFFKCTKSMLKNPKSIGLEIATGKQLWEINNTVNLQADTHSKLLRGYGGAYYQVLDPKKGELIINKDMSEYYEKGIFPVGFNNTISKDKLWFVSGQGENVRFGAINTQTSEIDFIQDYPLEEDWQLAKPVFHQGKLYLKDSNNVLHILE